MTKNDKKFYWFKMPDDFFSTDEIRLLEQEKNDASLIIFYLKLLCESVSKNGVLQVAPDKPYTDKQLSFITGKSIKFVKNSLAILQKVELIIIDKNGVIYFNKIEKYLGNETIWAEKKRNQRVAKKEGHCPQNVQDIKENRNKIKENRDKDNRNVSFDIDKAKEMSKTNRKTFGEKKNPKRHRE